jgi:hypothetical protein
MTDTHVQRIHQTLTEVFDLVHTATFHVDMTDFGDWLAALEQTEFYVSRYEHGPELHVHWAGMWNGHYVAVHARNVTAVLDVDIPDHGTFLTVPSIKSANLRGEAAQTRGGVR